MIEAMIESAMRSAELAEETGLGHDRIIISAKVSQVRDLVDVYRLLATRSDYPLHLGLTEAGLGDKGIISSTAGLAILLNEGIGDTIRVSLTPEPGGDRTEEVEIAQQVLQSMGLRSFLPQVTACPGCGRTTSTFFQEMAQQIQTYLKDRMPEWKETHPGVEEMRVAVMGCVVNGPGESKHADIGISLPGTFEEPVAPVFIDGKLDRTLRGDGLVDEFVGILEEYVQRRFRRARRTIDRDRYLRRRPDERSTGRVVRQQDQRANEGPEFGRRSGHSSRRLVTPAEPTGERGPESGRSAAFHPPLGPPAGPGAGSRARTFPV